jgi:hypothetical protein
MVRNSTQYLDLSITVEKTIVRYTGARKYTGSPWNEFDTPGFDAYNWPKDSCGTISMVGYGTVLSSSPLVLSLTL